MVDSTLATQIAREAAGRAALRVPAVVGPIPFGVSHHHLAFPGTLSLTSDLYAGVLKELIRCLYRHGVRRVVMVNAQGGNEYANATIANSLAHEEGLDMAIGHVA